MTLANPTTVRIAAILVAALVLAVPTLAAQAQTSPPAAAATALPAATIKALQEALTKQGIAVEASGVLNEETRSAIRRYQSQHHLPVTGEPDSATLAKLGVAAGQGETVPTQAAAQTATRAAGSTGRQAQAPSAAMPEEPMRPGTMPGDMMGGPMQNQMQGMMRMMQGMMHMMQGQMQQGREPPMAQQPGRRESDGMPRGPMQGAPMHGGSMPGGSMQGGMMMHCPMMQSQMHGPMQDRSRRDQMQGMMQMMQGMMQMMQAMQGQMPSAPQ